MRPEQFARTKYCEGLDLLSHLNSHLPSTLGLTPNQSDAFGCMAAAFVRKQIEHLRSLQVLLGQRCIGDATIVARAMVEAWMVLTWTGESKEERASRWRKFYSVETHRHIELLRKNRIEYEPDVTQAVNEALHRDAAPFEKKKGGYGKTWLEGTEYSRFRKTQEAPLVQLIWFLASAWVHSGPAASVFHAGPYVENVDGDASVVALADGCLTMAVALHSALGTAELAFEHLDATPDRSLLDLRRRVVEFLEVFSR